LHVVSFWPSIGGLAETPLHGGLVGPTFACIIGIQFRNLRKCDRFWYETGNPLVRFTESQLAELRRVTLSKVICEAGDAVSSIQRAAFDVPDPFLNPRISCDALPGLDLGLWKERVTCKVGETSIETGDARRVSPCVMCTCTKEGPLCQSLKIENCFHLAQSFSPKVRTRYELSGDYRHISRPYWTTTFARCSARSPSGHSPQSERATTALASARNRTLSSIIKRLKGKYVFNREWFLAFNNTHSL